MSLTRSRSHNHGHSYPSLDDYLVGIASCIEAVLLEAQADRDQLHLMEDFTFIICLFNLGEDYDRLQDRVDLLRGRTERPREVLH